MEFDELLITTGVDALVRLVKERQRIELPMAAKQLNLDAQTVEEWARILEEEGILRIQYKLTRVFLEWVPPTEEQVAKEKESFYQAKSGFEQEVAAVRTRLASENEELVQMREAFGKLYAKLAPRLEALEKAPLGLSVAPSPPAALGTFQTRLGEIRNDMNALRQEWKDFEKRTKTSALELGKTQSKAADELGTSLDALEKRAQKLTMGMPSELPGARELEKKVDALRKEFQEIRRKEAEIREGLHGVSEAGEIVSEMKGHLESHEQAIGSMRGELGQLRTQLTTLQEQSQAFGKRMKEEWEAMERFTDSAEVAKGILAKYPTQDRVLQELESMQERERTIQEKMDAVEKLLGAMGSPKELIDQFAALRGRIAEEKKALRGGAENFDRAMQEQKSLFATFEKIRERTTESMEGSTKELLQMQKQLDGLAQQNKQVAAQWEEQAKGWAKKTKEKDFQETLQALQDVREKKKLLDEIQKVMAELADRSEALTRKTGLLAQQAKLLELRTGSTSGGAPVAGAGKSGAAAASPAAGSASAAQQAQVAEVKSQLTLTQAEEEEFHRKREELKELIKKLWEQS